MIASPIILLLLVAVVGTVLLSLVLRTAREIVRTKEREKSRRELAAYVAEGTVRPGDAVRMMAAGEKPEFEKSERATPVTESAI